jgi:hypothetical protein
MDQYLQRVVNGILKADLVSDVSDAARLLDRSVEIAVNKDRATEDDLWPAIWALSAALERQFTGTISIDAGLNEALPSPAQLSSRCIFGKNPNPWLTIYLGRSPANTSEIGLHLLGDARNQKISYATLVEGSDSASPEACVAIAGYLGFAALALAANVPPFRDDIALHSMDLPLSEQKSAPKCSGLAFLGLGHLGQAFLSLLYFRARRGLDPGRIFLLDGGNFEVGNWNTQILVEADSHWIGASKAEYLEQRLRSWGFEVSAETFRIGWSWKADVDGPKVAVLGFDNFEARRIAMAAGYSWLIEAGLGDSFVRPKFTWHSIPPDRELAKRLFSDEPSQQRASGRFRNELESKPGCGHLHFDQVQASAPSMGLVASSFAWSELFNLSDGRRDVISGAGTLWSPILPVLRSVIS